MSANISAPPRDFVRRLTVLVGTGAAVLAAGAVIAPERVWANLLVASYYLVTLGLGGAVFIALTNVCGAGWSVAFRRVPEAMTSLLVAGLALLAVLAIRIPDYAWHHHGDGDAGTFWFKELWLNSTFFGVRAVGFVLLWIAFARVLVGNSRRQDDGTQPATGRINTGLSAVFLAVFAITISLASIDWIMALEPLWFSTMWGVYQFSGLIMGTLAAMIVACVTLRRFGPLQGVFRDDHLHDLGKLLLGFSCFWMYIWFSQYMLIWYSNLPEETAYFVRRTHGAWGPVVIGSLVLNWVVPFFVLLPQKCKRSEGVMLKVAVVVLIGRWVDLYVMVFPALKSSSQISNAASSVDKHAAATVAEHAQEVAHVPETVTWLFAQPVFGILEVAAIACATGITGLLFAKAFLGNRVIPRNDPLLEESLHYHA